MSHKLRIFRAKLIIDESGFGGAERGIYNSIAKFKGFKSSVLPLYLMELLYVITKKKTHMEVYHDNYTDLSELIPIRQNSIIGYLRTYLD